jgi:hypothetical protein
LSSYPAESRTIYLSPIDMTFATSYSSKFKQITLAVLCLLLPASAWTQIRSGSIVVMSRSRQKVIIAADSRVNLGNGKYEDSYCKITALSDNLIFAATGIVGDSSYLLPENLRFGATEEARKAFVSYSQAPEDFLDLGKVGTIASKWGAAMSEHFRKAADASPASFQEWRKRIDLSHESAFIVGLFAGLEPDGQISVYSVNVDFVEPQKGFLPTEPYFLRSTPIPDEAPNDFSLTQVFGMPEIYDEINAGKTDRAKQEIRQRHYLEMTSFPEVFARSQVIRMIDLTIAYHPKQEFVGGKIDAVELPSSGKVTWLQRKENCPAN